MLKIPERLEVEVYRCVRCGFCTSLCPIYGAKGIDSWNCRGRVLVERALLEGELEATRNVLDRLYTCTLCKTCETGCPAKVKVTDLMLAVREALIDQGIGPLEEHRELIEFIVDGGNIFGEPSDLSGKSFSPLLDRLPSQAPAIYYSGCVSTHRQPEITEASILLLGEGGLDFTLLKEGEECCGGYIQSLGCRDAFRDRVEENIASFEERGVERIITGCPLCYTAFSKEYKKISNNVPETLHMDQVLQELIERGKLKPKRMVEARVAYKDSCHLGRYMNIYNAPRKILESIPGLKLVELPESRETAKCCGGPIKTPYRSLRNTLSKAIMRQAREAGADYLATSCPTCLHNLTVFSVGAHIPVISTTHLVAYSTGLVDTFLPRGTS